MARPFFKTRTMATKRYIAKSHVSISVNTPNGSGHITFSPLTGGNKSAYYTDNEELQKALEAHPRFGKLFRLDPTFQPVKEVKVAEAEASAPKRIKKVKVSCLDDAKEYLCEKYEVSRTKLNSEKAIKEFAAGKNIEFVGI